MGGDQPPPGDLSESPRISSPLSAFIALLGGSSLAWTWSNVAVSQFETANLLSLGARPYSVNMTSQRMEWGRLRSRAVVVDGRIQEPFDAEPKQMRSSFEKDFDRVVYSAPFRRLQNKTQVHTLPINDHVRNRLTHSLEAST